MTPLFFAMPGNEDFTRRLTKLTNSESGSLNFRRFPDKESYLRFDTSVEGRSVVLVNTLDAPDEKTLPLFFAAKTARELGATDVGLVAPYLAYMRQDRRFRPGEAVTSRTVAELLSAAFDFLITVDPHLHRYHALSDIYSIPAQAVQAAPLLSEWIKVHAANGVLIGPDGESEQWVSAVAAGAGRPFTVLEKIRHGDRDVEIRIKDARLLAAHVPVFVDDIISSGRTMLEAIKQVKNSTSASPVCVAVHGLFAGRSDELLRAAGAQLVTTNTVAHASNAIDVCGLLAACLDQGAAS